MKFTTSWLKEHLDTDASLEELTTRLSAIGLEVEDVTDPAANLHAFTIARVLEAKQHPDADRLRVCQVDTGSGTVEVVCGAPNAKTGLIGVFAPTGTYIPGTGITLEARPVRGVVSHGMLLSERELELSDDHDGIIELDPSLESRVGERYSAVMGLDDPVIEVGLTSNRPDCLGVNGIARDLAAAGLGKVKSPVAAYDGKRDFDCPVPIELKFSDDTADACSMFAGQVIRGVQNGPSPAWLQQRLRAIGLRPISTLVDITNLITMGHGRPLHVYDIAKLTGTVHARLGKKGESFEALDGKTYEVDENMCVIADDSGVLGLGGIIGGESTGVSEGTTDVLIEAAYFDPIRTATTGRKLNLQTDARYRFERGVDPAFVEPGLAIATTLILELCGGEASKPLVAGSAPLPETVIDFDFDRVEKLTGLVLKPEVMRKTLNDLGFAVTGKGKAVKVAVPSWRPDATGSADLVEEVVRIAGIDTVPSTPMPRGGGVTRAVLTSQQQRARRTRRILAGRGLVEAVTWSFIAREQAQHFGGGSDELELDNPISVDLSSMRPTLLSGLLSAAARNHDRGYADCALFEVGQIYRGDQPGDQVLAAAAVRSGTARLNGAGRHWNGSAASVDVFDAKADASAVLTALGLDVAKVQVTRDAPAWFHPGRSGTLRLGPKIVLAHFGELHPATLKDLGLPGPTAAFELFVSDMPPEKRRTRAKAALDASDLMPVRRDFAFVLDDAVAAGDVIRAASAADKRLITNVSVFDQFSGERLGAGRKSLAIEVTLQPQKNTLTDEDIDAVGSKIIAAVQKATGGEIRS